MTDYYQLCWWGQNRSTPSIHPSTTDWLFYDYKSFIFLYFLRHSNLQKGKRRVSCTQVVLYLYILFHISSFQRTLQRSLTFSLSIKWRNWGRDYVCVFMCMAEHERGWEMARGSSLRSVIKPGISLLCQAVLHKTITYLKAGRITLCCEQCSYLINFLLSPKSPFCWILFYRLRGQLRSVPRFLMNPKLSVPLSLWGKCFIIGLTW